ncbi:MAG: cyclic pyranopterin monophosphate synthase MoaC [Thermoanaerobaculia bacterium]
MMEAMTACAVAPLTIYEMCWSAEKGIVIESGPTRANDGRKEWDVGAVVLSS